MKGLRRLKNNTDPCGSGSALIAETIIDDVDVECIVEQMTVYGRFDDD
jgi:hypothetical protein